MANGRVSSEEIAGEVLKMRRRSDLNEGSERQSKNGAIGLEQSSLNIVW